MRGVLVTGTVAETQSINVEVNQYAKVERDETFTVSLDEIVFLDPDPAQTVPLETEGLDL